MNVKLQLEVDFEVTVGDDDTKVNVISQDNDHLISDGFSMIRIVGMRIMIVVSEVLIMRAVDYTVMPSAMVFRLMWIAMTRTMLV